VGRGRGGDRRAAAGCRGRQHLRGRLRLRGGRSRGGFRTQRLLQQPLEFADARVLRSQLVFQGLLSFFDRAFVRRTGGGVREHG
jgi:hypothetical protein